LRIYHWTLSQSKLWNALPSKPHSPVRSFRLASQHRRYLSTALSSSSISGRMVMMSQSHSIAPPNEGMIKGWNV
jgi:hypothetical protein